MAWYTVSGQAARLADACQQVQDRLRVGLEEAVTPSPDYLST